MPISHVPNLWAMEIEPDQATTEYKERILGPMRGVFPPKGTAVVEEQFNSPCTTEIAAFDRFVKFMDDPGRTTWSSSIRPPRATLFGCWNFR